MQHRAHAVKRTLRKFSSSLSLSLARLRCLVASCWLPWPLPSPRPSLGSMALTARHQAPGCGQASCELAAWPWTQGFLLQLCAICRNLSTDELRARLRKAITVPVRRGVKTSCIRTVARCSSVRAAWSTCALARMRTHESRLVSHDLFGCSPLHSIAMHVQSRAQAERKFARQPKGSRYPPPDRRLRSVLSTLLPRLNFQPSIRWKRNVKLPHPLRGRQPHCAEN